MAQRATWTAYGLGDDWGDWLDEAACLGADPGLFVQAVPRGMTSDTPDERAAKQVCMFCPVQADCLEAALAYPALRGVWGGTNTHERHVIRRERRRAS